MRSIPAMLAGAGLLCVVPAGATRAGEPRLDFQVEEGLNLNHLVRQGAVAAHLLLRSGDDPRILIAFPAGDSGVAVWFVHQADAAHWSLSAPPRPVHELDASGRVLYGITALATVTARELEVRQAVLSSIRVLRDYERLGSAPALVSAAAAVRGNTLTWSRDRLDGAPGYRLVLEVTQGQLHDGRIRAGPDGRSACASPG